MALDLSNLQPMEKSAFDFLTAVLGIEGAKALARTAHKEPQLATLFVPRAALSWVNHQKAYEGSIPGIENSYIKFAKTESGFHGIVTLPETNYEFSNATAEHLAAAMSITLGANISSARVVRDVTLVKLGKSIDVLVEAQGLARKLAKRLLDPSVGYNIKEEELPGGLRVHAYDREGKHLASAWFESRENALHEVNIDTTDDEIEDGLKQALKDHAKKFSGKNIAKTELPGQTHKPQTQQGPEAPQPPAKQPTMKKPKLPKIPALKVEKSEASRECPDCGGQQFKDGKFRGCLCHRDLAKSVRASSYSDGFVLEFTDRVAFVAFKKLLKD